MSDLTRGLEDPFVDSVEPSGEAVSRLQTENGHNVAPDATGPDTDLTDEHRATNLRQENQELQARLDRLRELQIESNMDQTADSPVINNAPRQLAFIDYRDDNTTNRVTRVVMVDRRNTGQNANQNAGLGNVATNSNNTSVNNNVNESDNPASIGGNMPHRYRKGRSVEPNLNVNNTFCMTCYEYKPSVDVFSAKCRHNYCRDCLQLLFKASIGDGAFFPPKCCNLIIPFDLVRHLLTADVANIFEKKQVEYDTVDKTYCSSAKCSTFMPPSTIEGSIAECVECKTRTCTICKQAEHFGACPELESQLQTLQVARDSSWQSCYRCWTVIELRDGCHHIVFVVPPLIASFLY